MSVDVSSEHDPRCAKHRDWRDGCDCALLRERDIAIRQAEERGAERERARIRVSMEALPDNGSELLSKDDLYRIIDGEDQRDSVSSPIASE